jgi:hypothetical protein
MDCGRVPLVILARKLDEEAVRIVARRRLSC